MKTQSRQSSTGQGLQASAQRCVARAGGLRSLATPVLKEIPLGYQATTTSFLSGLGLTSRGGGVSGLTDAGLPAVLLNMG